MKEIKNSTYKQESNRKTIEKPTKQKNYPKKLIKSIKNPKHSHDNNHKHW